MTWAVTDIAFVRGLVAGFALAVPLGPVAVLCIRRALAGGRFECFVAGLGAAVADTIFAGVAGLGITFIAMFIERFESIIGLIGGAIVVMVGVLTYRAPVCHITGAAKVQSLRRDTLTAFTMAITNPATMLGAAGIFAAFGPIHLKTEPIKAFWLVIGAFAGSALWWLLLALIVGTLKQKFVDGGLLRLNKIAGAIIAASGVAVLVVVTVRML